jgi:hypothetical protein
VTESVADALAKLPLRGNRTQQTRNRRAQQDAAGGKSDTTSLRVEDAAQIVVLAHSHDGDPVQALPGAQTRRNGTKRFGPDHAREVPHIQQCVPGAQLVERQRDVVALDSVELDAQHARRAVEHPLSDDEQPGGERDTEHRHARRRQPALDVAQDHAQRHRQPAVDAEPVDDRWPIVRRGFGLHRLLSAQALYAESLGLTEILDLNA